MTVPVDATIRWVMFHRMFSFFTGPARLLALHRSTRMYVAVFNTTCMYVAFFNKRDMKSSNISRQFFFVGAVCSSSLLLMYSISHRIFTGEFDSRN